MQENTKEVISYLTPGYNFFHHLSKPWSEMTGSYEPLTILLTLYNLTLVGAAIDYGPIVKEGLEKLL